MSKYTTQLRFLVESNTPIFDFDYNFYDNTKKSTFEQHFIDHFYLREIGSETVGTFKLYLKRFFREKLPYYNELFKISQLEYDKLNNFSILENRTLNKTNENDGTQNNTVDESGQSKITGSGTDTITALKKRLDTPQGMVQIIDDYLSNVTQEDSSANNTSTSDGTNSSTSTGNSTIHNNSSSSESFSKSYEGHSNTTQAEMLLKHLELQKKLQTIELNFFHECDELFMQVF